jgi:hypothetical protein
MTNAFTIPKKSAVLASLKRIPKVYRVYPQNFPQISLPGSSKSLPPTMMQPTGVKDHETP